VAGGASHSSFVSLARVNHDLLAWHHRPGWPEAIRVDVPSLLQALFPDQRPFSTSDLETYAACPFRYFGSRVLRLSEREADDSRWLYGSLVHRVFQRFYEELRAALKIAADQPLPAVAEGHARRLREIFEQEWQAHEEGRLSPELAPLFAHPRGVIRLFLEAMEQLERTYGNLLNEHVLGDGRGGGIVIGRDAAGRPVAVSGKIDRVDVRRDNAQQAVIADYKTGRPQDSRVLKEKLADGRLMQLPLYAATLEIAHGELQVVGGLYLHLSERAHKEEPGGSDVLIPVGEVLPGGKPESQPAFDPAAARRKALEFAGLIRQGDFPLSPHTSGNSCECTSYCSFRHACRQPHGYETK
jgi:ATP-dependent helicase/DNAse subunit B